MKAVGYIRVSTEGQAQDGVSLDAQRAKIEAWALANDAELLAVEVDAGISGKRADNREGLQRALERACKEKAALVSYSLSRVSRSTRDTLALADRLERAGADLVSLSEKIDTTSAAGKMVFRLLAVLSEFERDQVSERTKAALFHKRTKGEKTGGRFAPYGYDALDGKLVENSEEQETIKRIQALRGQGWTLREICAALEADGIPAKGGGRWAPKVVRAILLRKAS